MKLGHVLLASVCLWTVQAYGFEVGGLRHIATVDLPAGTAVDGMLYGGISGIAYDPAADRYLLLSDDKSDKAPARFYAARIGFDANAASPVELLGVFPILAQDNRPFPKAGEGGEVLDAEALLLDPRDQSLIFASEGDSKGGFDPSLRRMSPHGQVTAAIPLPQYLRFAAEGVAGPRPNNTIEGLAIASDEDALWLALEAPLVEDGAVATLEAGGLTRLIRLGADGAVQAAFAYPIDPIQAQKTGQFSDNGVSDILAVDADTLLVLERSGVQAEDGSWTFYIRLYQAELSAARDVKDVSSIAGMPEGVAIKTLLLDFNKAGIGHVDNLEAMTWGKTLANGSRSLVVASDDNFDLKQTNQVMVFEVVEP